MHLEFGLKHNLRDDLKTKKMLYKPRVMNISLFNSVVKRQKDCRSTKVS